MNDEGRNQRITTKHSNSKNSVLIAKQGKTERATLDGSAGHLAFTYVNLEVKDKPRQEMQLENHKHAENANADERNSRSHNGINTRSRP